MRQKVRNLIGELHRKVGYFLVKNFDGILLPRFETSQMALHGARRLRSKSVRQMMSFAHYRFKQFLKHKAFEFGKLVIDCCEAYTSKTVSWTGEIVQNLGGRKTISSADGRKLDRDLNGARGIFLCALVETPRSFRMRCYQLLAKSIVTSTKLFFLGFIWNDVSSNHIL